MKLNPSLTLRKREITHGLDLVIKEGLTSEAMTTLTGGTFLMAMALLLGASNFQIGLVAALPTITNGFQIITTWLLQKYNNRRATAVIANGLARLPLLLIGMLPLIFSADTSFATIIFILVFHYLFGSIAGASWNSWMKDLVPGDKLGSYFSRRTSRTQTLNVCLSLALALLLDYIKDNYPGMELRAYAVMFVLGGALGLFGTWLLSKTPEPVSYLPKENILKLYKRPLKDKNFRSLLRFQFCWTFALNIATPFMTVFLLKSLNLKLSTVIVATICSQIAGIIAVKRWGKYTDQFSNKTILRIAAPLYIACILMWPVAGLYSNIFIVIAVVILLNILSGIASSGVNLSLNNIAIKLAPKNEAVVYLSAKSMMMSLTGAVSPLLGGFLADYFSEKQFNFNINLHGFAGFHIVRLINLQGYGFLFLAGGILALAALQLLKSVKEEGELSKKTATLVLKTKLRNQIRKTTHPGYILSFVAAPVQRQIQLHRKIRNRWHRKLA